MGFSRLQRSILLTCYPNHGRVDRRRFLRLAEQAVTQAKDPVDALTKALERLIGRGLLVGYGTRTKERWFIKEVRLTPAGRRAARWFAGQQQALPLGGKAHRRADRKQETGNRERKGSE